MASGAGAGAVVGALTGGVIAAFGAEVDPISAPVEAEGVAVRALVWTRLGCSEPALGATAAFLIAGGGAVDADEPCCSNAAALGPAASAGTTLTDLLAAAGAGLGFTIGAACWPPCWLVA